MSSEEYSSSPEVRTGFVLGDTFGYRRVQYHVIDGEAIFEGDIVLGSRLVAEINGEPGVASAVVIKNRYFRWRGGVVPYTIDPDLPDVARINEAIAHWHARTNIRFVARTNEEDFVTFRPGNVCQSAIGMQGNGQQFITLRDDCHRGNVMHEIGHTVGLWHEQSRKDRDQFVRINWANIIPTEEDNFDQHITDGDDVGSYDYGSIMHYEPLAFSVNNLPTIEALNGAAIGQRNGLSDGDVQAVNFMYSSVIPVILQPGVYTIQQQSNVRFVDAHESSQNVTEDFTLVTRPEQNNDSQRWILTPVGGEYIIRQESNDRYVDAHEGPWGRFDDFTLVTRAEAQPNDTQRWILIHLGQNVYTIQQKSNGRFVDAHDENAGKDFTLVTREAQDNDTQRWILNHLGRNVYTIRHKRTDRFVDAYEFQDDFTLVTKPAEDSDTQRWLLTPVSVFYTIRQKSNGRFVDAHDGPWGPFDDFALVTREAQPDDSQTWILTYMGGIIGDLLSEGGKIFTIRQKSTDRFVDAHAIEERDFCLVTRPERENDKTQRWLFKKPPLVVQP
jgi:hypothetical protein